MPREVGMLKTSLDSWVEVVIRGWYCNIKKASTEVELIVRMWF